MTYLFSLIISLLYIAFYLVLAVPAFFYCLYKHKVSKVNGAMRWFMYWTIEVFFNFFATLVSPILPLLATVADGPILNNNGTGVEPRLLGKSAIFGTPDNSLYGDHNWRLNNRNYADYWTQVRWLLRNTGYGFKWSFLAAPITGQLINPSDGTPVTKEQTHIDKQYPENIGKSHLGVMNDYFQYKSLFKIGFGYAVALKLGWLIDNYLDDEVRDGSNKALFLFSPRPFKLP